MPALITPFDEEGHLVEADFRHNLAVLTDMGMEGFLVGGSTGEGPYLEPGERARLVSAARDELGDRPFLMCGVAAETVRVAVEQAGEAAGAGADAVLVLTPTTLARRDVAAPFRFYDAVAGLVELPLMLYSVPVVTAYELPLDDVTRLSARQGVAGMKDSGGDAVRAQRVVAAAAEDFMLFAGNSAAVSLSIAAGAYGAITASANYAPTLVKEVVAAARKGTSKVADLQERLAGLAGLVEARGVASVKLAASVAGLRPGVPRRPLAPLPEAEGDALRRRLEAMRGQLLG